MPNETKLTDPGARAIDAFITRVAAARERVLMLDYDGTLAPFCLKPRDAKPYPGVGALLTQLRDAGTRVIIVSGRSLADLQSVAVALPHDEAWGCHGWQRRIGESAVTRPAPTLEALDVLHAASLAAAPLTRLGARLECKPTGVAVHWRGLGTTAAATLRTELSLAWQGGGGDAVEIVDFDGGVEMRARGVNKGSAVRAVLAEAGDNSACAYLGDDITDEDAFAAIEGRGLGVLVRNVPRPTRAQGRVSAPSGLLQFLKMWRSACAAGTSGVVA